jgi:hypothetical protein
MKLYKFSELTQEAKKVAVQEFIIDAKSFGFFDEEEHGDEEKVHNLLSSPHETHRYDENGILHGKVRYYRGQEIFEETGMY